MHTKKLREGILNDGLDGTNMFVINVIGVSAVNFLAVNGFIDSWKNEKVYVIDKISGEVTSYETDAIGVSAIMHEGKTVYGAKLDWYVSLDEENFGSMGVRLSPISVEIFDNLISMHTLALSEKFGVQF